MQSKPTTVLLAVIAALLAANLIVNLPPQEAKAQTHLAAIGNGDDVVLVGISVVGTGAGLFHILRLWSGRRGPSPLPTPTTGARETEQA